MDFDDFLSQIAGDLKPEDPTLDEKLMGQAISSLSGETDKKIDWHPFAGPQTMARDSKADEIFFGGAAGGGKFCNNSAKIATPFGWTTHGEVKVGDQVCDPTTGGIQRVIGVYPQGKQKLYEFEFADGAKVKAGADHLWAYWLSSTNVKADRYMPVVNLETNDIEMIDYSDYFGSTTDLKVQTTTWLKAYHDKQQEKFKEGKRPYWILMPLTKPIRYTRTLNPEMRNHWIDPYFLGLLIGDGSITGNSSITITTKDEFILEEVRRIYGEEFTKWDGDKTIRLNGSSKLKENLDFWKLLGTRSSTKFIPDAYLYAGVDDRFSLIAGLLDTDGYIDDRGHVSYTTVSETLAKNFQQLAWSLGMKARITSDQGGYKNESGEKIICQIAYTVYIQGGQLERCFRLPRKKERYKPYKGGYEPGRRVVAIREMDEEEECTCIMVENLHHLYITDDFIVTHNTYLILGLALTEHKRSIIFRREYKQLSEIVEKSRELLQPFPEATYNGTDYRWRGIPGGRILEFGSIPTDQSVTRYQGRAHDLKAFDEISNFCLHEDAEVYTRRGWIKLKDATTDDEVISCNKYMNISWEKIEKVLEFPYNGNLMHVKTKLLDFMCTPNHKLVTWVRNNLFILKEVQDFNQAEQLPVPMGLPLPAEKDSELETQYNVWRLEKIQKTDITQVPYSGNVYCLQVPPLRTFLARMNGKMFWSGNSSNQYRFLIGWARTDDPHQRVRILSAGNPPTNAEGEWVLQRWGAWLDPQHSNPAKPGELRWFVVIDGDDVEVEDNKPIKHKDEIIVPRSRTFIPSRVEDNPVYMASGYKSVLQALPEPLRSQMLYGSFNLNMADDPNGVIPMSWIREAQNRWKALHKEGVVDKMRNAAVSFGLDVASGGGDRTALCKLTGTIVQWIHIMRITGDEDLFKQADWVLMQLEGHKAAPIGVDAIGVGAGLYHRLRNLALRVSAIKGSQGTDIKDRTGHLAFLNLRAAMWWMMRDALDPDGKTLLALPPDDRELAAELAAPKWNTTAIGRIQIEAKESVRDRLGRSPDKAEALLMAFYVNSQRRPPLRMI